MDRYNALEEYKNISQWKRLFNRMANFYGGSLAFDDFNIKNFVIHNNEIHILDFDNIFVVNSPEESIQMNTEQLKHFLTRNHSMVGEGRVINDIMTI